MKLNHHSHADLLVAAYYRTGKSDTWLTQGNIVMVAKAYHYHAGNFYGSFPQAQSTRYACRLRQCKRQHAAGRPATHTHQGQSPRHVLRHVGGTGPCSSTVGSVGGGSSCTASSRPNRGSQIGAVHERGPKKSTPNPLCSPTSQHSLSPSRRLRRSARRQRGSIRPAALAALSARISTVLAMRRHGCSRSCLPS